MCVYECVKDNKMQFMKNAQQYVVRCLDAVAQHCQVVNNTFMELFSKHSKELMTMSQDVLSLANVSVCVSLSRSLSLSLCVCMCVYVCVCVKYVCV